VPYYMAIECFLIHFRALRDFLCPDELVRKKNDNVIAFDYNSEWLQTEEDWKECSIDERIRVNRLLAHISYSRDTLERKWPIEAMRQSMMQRLAQFILSLPAKRQEWFESWGLNKTMAASIRRV
jgi:hypothetical protein